MERLRIRNEPFSDLKKVRYGKLFFGHNSQENELFHKKDGYYTGGRKEGEGDLRELEL